ncbi:MAG TPA: alkaline phosphatase D family protein [Kofleriaceae bacterium]|nr:alkaline phosphatase D family protein [Kofleriaceae bacterium]
MSDPTRRDFVRLLGVGAAAVRLAGCGDDASPRDAAAAVLDPTASGLLVAVWARRARTATIELRDGDAVMTAQVELDDAGSGAIELTGLAAATTYELTVTTADGIVLGPHVARTAPSDDVATALRIAVIADIDPSPEFETDLVEHVIAARPDVIVSLGDFPYTDNGPPADTLASYRERHAEIRTLPRFRTLLEAAPLVAIYDDHEFRNNWDAAFVAAEPARYAAAMTVWDEFFPVREADPEIRYRAWRWGAHVECFVLDTRRFRSANAAPDDANKTMLGAAQKAWLLDGLARSTATFKLVLTSVPLDYGTGDDHWASFTTERDAILDAIVGIPGILFVTADQHWFAAHRHAHGVREIQVGPLARGIATPGPVVDGVLFRGLQYNAGLLDVTSDRIVVTAIGPGGERLYEETLTAADLTPRR